MNTKMNTGKIFRKSPLKKGIVYKGKIPHVEFVTHLFNKWARFNDANDLIKLGRVVSLVGLRLLISKMEDKNGRVYQTLLGYKSRISRDYRMNVPYGTNNDFCETILTADDIVQSVVCGIIEKGSVKGGFNALSKCIYKHKKGTTTMISSRANFDYNEEVPQFYNSILTKTQIKALGYFYEAPFVVYGKGYTVAMKELADNLGVSVSSLKSIRSRIRERLTTADRHGKTPLVELSERPIKLVVMRGDKVKLVSYSIGQEYYKKYLSN